MPIDILGAADSGHDTAACPSLLLQLRQLLIEPCYLRGLHFRRLLSVGRLKLAEIARDAAATEDIGSPTCCKLTTGLTGN